MVWVFAYLHGVGHCCGFTNIA